MHAFELPPWQEGPSSVGIPAAACGARVFPNEQVVFGKVQRPERCSYIDAGLRAVLSSAARLSAQGRPRAERSNEEVNPVGL